MGCVVSTGRAVDVCLRVGALVGFGELVGPGVGEVVVGFGDGSGVGGKV